jgi:hypothetical protein
MPRTAVAIQSVTRNSHNIAAEATGDNANGNSVPNDGQTVFLLRNPTGGSVTVTFVSVADEAGRVGDISRVLAASEVNFVGPLKPAHWNQTDGTVSVNWTATGCKITALKLPSL